MALKEIAVEGMTLEPDDPLVSATISITGSSSSKSKAEGKGIYKDNLSISVSAITKPPATVPDSGPYTANFSSSASKVKVDGNLVLLDGDETETINATPKLPNGTPNPISFKVKIQSAGQSKVKAQ